MTLYYFTLNTNCVVEASIDDSRPGQPICTLELESTLDLMDAIQLLQKAVDATLVGLSERANKIHDYSEN